MDKINIKLDIESKKVLKKLPDAHKALAELKGIAETIPNQQILINTLVLQEAKDSSEVENIVTTNDEIFKAELDISKNISIATKEVQNYSTAMKKGFALVKENRILTNNIILEIQSELEKNNAGFRKLPGTALKNNKGETVYTPPQDANEIKSLMSDLEKFINDDSLCDWNDLVKMAVVHYQFESIHPFYDGNGRTGRIINILYLIKQNLLKIPILYLSRYINQNKALYYRLLQSIRDNEGWEDWILYVLDAIEKTSLQTINMINDIRELMFSYKQIIREKLPKIYNQDLLNNLFNHPYTKIEFLMSDLQVNRLTASRYLNKLVEIGLLEKRKIGRSNYYINNPLILIFSKDYSLKRKNDKN